MSTFTYDSTNEANLMKIKYGKIVEKQFNMENVLFGRIKKSSNFVGSSIQEPVVQSIGGGVGAGSLPVANKNKIGKTTLTTKKLYATVSIDRETMKAGKQGEGAFVEMSKFPVKIATKSFNRNLERMLTRAPAASTGLLASGDSTTAISGAGTAGDPYLITLAAGSNMASFEEGDYLNRNSATAIYEVISVDESGLVLGLFDVNTVGTVANSDALYMQGSKDQEVVGVQAVCEATSGTYNGIAVGRRWQAYQKAAGASALSTDLMNDVVINTKKQCGVAPKIILTSYKQYIKLLNLLEDHKRYSLPARDKSFKGQISFQGVEYIGPEGSIPVFSSRFVDDDVMLFLNDDHIELKCRPGGFEWFDEDGTVFLRETGDSYEARYGGYASFHVNPHFQGILDGLA